MSGKIDIYVKAEGEASEVEDKDVPGEYLIELDATLDSKDYANAALDVFHESVAVGMLEDFSFRVFTADGTELHDDGNGDYRFKSRGNLAGKVDGVPFETEPGPRSSTRC
jgi:hypothetical protein